MNKLLIRKAWFWKSITYVYIKQYRFVNAIRVIRVNIV